MYYKVSLLYVFEDTRCYRGIPVFYKIKVYFLDTLSRRTYFCDKAVPCRSGKCQNDVQLNPNEDKNYLPTPYPSLTPPLKKFSPKSKGAITRNPKNYTQSTDIYSRSDIQHHLRTQQFQEIFSRKSDQPDPPSPHDRCSIRA